MRVYQEELENYRIVEYIIDYATDYEMGDLVNIDMPPNPQPERTVIVVRGSDNNVPAWAIAAVVAEIAQNYPAAIAIASQEGEAIVVYSRIRFVEPGYILEYSEAEWEWVNL